MVGNSYSRSPLSRALEAIDGVGGRIRTLVDRRQPLGRRSRRQAVLVSIIVLAGAALLVLPKPDRDPAAEAFALQALAEPSAPTTERAAVESTYEVSEQSAESRESDGWAAAIDGAKAAATLDLSLFSRQETTTTEAATTTAAPTSAAPPTTASTSAAADEADDGNGEGAQASPEDGADGTGTETTEPDAEATSTEPETTTTTSAPTTTTAAGNGYVDAGHGVFVPPVLLSIRWCESRDNYTAANPSSSARGAYQFLTGSWAGYGHADRYGVSQAHLATPAQQDEAALITWERDGTRPWNASRHCWG